MKIVLYGIEFSHRRPTAHDYVFGDYAEFGAFAALCHARGLANLIESVFFDHNFMGYEITMRDPALKHTTAHREVNACAEASLSQFHLFDMVGHKRDDLWSASNGHV